MSNKYEDIKGINKKIFDWAKKTSFFHLSEEEKKLLEQLLGTEQAMREKASKKFAENIWKKYPELGPMPFFALLSENEYKRSFYENYRDHTTHQVKVFLLGAYIYDKCDAIQERINTYLHNEFSELKENEINRIFIVIWTATALYHDIGYLVEGTGADSSNTPYCDKIIKIINDMLEYPLANTIGLGFNSNVERNNIKYKANKINSITSLEDERTYEILAHFGELSCLSQNDKNAIKEYYDFAQKQDTGERKSFRDHGIASALLMMKIWKSYEKNLQEICNYKAQNPKNKNSVEKAKALYDKIDIIRKEINIAAGAIALHNINKKYWKPEEIENIALEDFCLELVGDNALPIAFLLRVVDELQDWDRVYYRPITDDDDVLSGKDVDIEVKEDAIYVEYVRDNLNFRHPDSYCGGRFSKLIKKLSLYLDTDTVRQILKYGVESDSTESYEKEWGLKNIYPSRSEAHVDYNKEGFAKESCDIIAFGLKNLRSNVGELIEKNVEKGLKIRILTLQPDSLFVKKRELQEGLIGSIRDSILELLDWIQKIRKLVPKGLNADENVQVRFYDSVPLDFYCKLDDKVYIGPYLAGKESRDIITYEFGNGSISKMYTDYFEKLWNSEIRGINPVDKAYIYEIRTQKEIVEQVLKTFCNILSDFHDTDNKVRGIAVKYLIENNKRKTIFFWNKKDGSQSYPEVARNFGVVGKMDEYKCPYIHHFKKRGVGTYYFFSERNEEQELEHVKEAGGKKEDQKAILVAPIWDKIKENLMGIITFEFIEEPINFEKLDEEIEQYKNLKGDIMQQTSEQTELQRLHHMFNIAKECAFILAEIIVNYVEVDEDKLFEKKEYGK